MSIRHVFDTVGDQLARRQAVEHPFVSHRDPVVDSDGVELLRHAASRFDLPRDELPEVLEVYVAGHELRERIHDRDDRLAEIGVCHSGRSPQTARARHVAAVGRRT